MTTNKQTTMNSTTMKPSNMELLRLPNVRMIQNFHLVWLDGSIDEVNDDNCHSSMTKLREVVNNVKIFADVDECIDFITDIKEEKTFMIISEEFSETIISIIQDILQVNSVYIFSRNNAGRGKWAEQYSKIKGIYTDITPICEALKQDAHDCEQNSVSISFVKTVHGTANPNLDTLDQSFMYTQILKEILLTIDFEQVHFHEFLTYCREQFTNNAIQLRNVDKIEREYHDHQPIWWYTYQCFLYSMLNRALRLMEVDIIIKMGFFVRDLHKHIDTLHVEQYGAQNNSGPFTVYRGQGLPQTDFDQLKNTQGGLLAFNNFLSTSESCDVSLRFAQRAITTSNLVGVLFILKIDHSIAATPFANIKKASCYQREEEILFSMHSVFRIGQMEQIEKNDRLWQVELTLTSDHDPQLRALTKYMQTDTKGPTGWFRLAKFLIKVAQFDKAQQVFDIILDQTADEREEGEIYHYLGWIKADQGKNSEALSYYEKAREIEQKTLPANHPDLATSYGNIGTLYYTMGEYSKALSYYEKALEIFQKTLPANHPSLATSYSNIGLVCKNMGEYSKALSYYEKVLEISQKTLPANHPDLAGSYHNIGGVYANIGEYSKALSYYEKALKIFQKTLPANHPNLATSYNNIGGVYNNMGEYSKALSYYEKVLEISQKTLPANHPNLATSYNNIGGVYDNMGQYSKALSYCEHGLKILECSLPPNHSTLQTVRRNIEVIKRNLK